MSLRNCCLWFYLALSVALIAVFVGPVTLPTTTLAVVVGTFLVTLGAVFLVALPAFILAGMLAGYFEVPRWMRGVIWASCYTLAGMPSIIIGIVGFLVFCHLMGFGWSMLSAMLTLTLLLYPTLTTGFEQVLRPFHQQYRGLANSLGIRAPEFLLKQSVSMNKKPLLNCLILAWATSLGDTAAVMLTCGALLDFPESVMSSVRLLNYHIYLLAMEVPGGLPEARSLSLLVVVGLLLLLGLPRVIAHGYLHSQRKGQPA